MKLKDSQLVDCAHTRNRVVDSRDSLYGIRRRRECVDCGHRWSTVEIAVADNAISPDAGRAYRQRVKRALYRQLAKQFSELADGLERKGIKHLESK